MSEIKRMDIKEFREKGYLQEVNRWFFHPLGLALEVIVNDETGEEKLGGVWDYRERPQGIAFPAINEEMAARAAYIESLRAEKAWVRLEAYGWVIQPVGDDE
jgi:hypothetical protein